MDLYVIDCDIQDTNSLGYKIGELKEFMTADEYKRQFAVMAGMQGGVIDVHTEYIRMSPHGYSIFCGHRGKEVLIDMDFYDKMSSLEKQKTYTYGYQQYLKFHALIAKQIKRNEIIQNILGKV